MAQTSQADLDLADEIAKFYDDPLGFVMFAYDWDNDPTLQVCELPEPWASRYNCKWGPDQWACELLERVGHQVRENSFDGRHPVPPIREAVASGHGIGKSAMTAWLTDWIMSTRPNAKGTVTATTSPQLASKTWPQIVSWTKKCITGHWFDLTTGRGSMAMKHKEYPDDWYCNAQTCAEENSEAFAGQHNVTSTSFYIFDEASGVPDKIQEVSEGGLTDGEPMMFAFANPTENDGWFYDCFHGQRHRWNTQQVDSRTVQITNKVTIQEWIDDYGLDSDFVKIRVRGMFPAMSAKQYISVKDLDAAYGRHLRVDQYNFAPKVLVLDSAWQGDDELVISVRQGLYFEILRTIPKNDNDIEIATLLRVIEDELGADAVFIDIGYGTGVYSAGVTWGRDWQLVDFGGASPEIGCFNMRAFMYKEARDWMKKGGALPKDTVLYNEVVSVHTVPRSDGLVQIESKKDMKARGVPSPNRLDTLVISFAYPVEKKSPLDSIPRKAMQAREHNPYDGLGRTHEEPPEEHNPYANIR